MLIELSPDGSLPLHEQVAAAIRAAVRAGRAAPGERLPSARSLAEDLQMNMHTVLRAYQTLRDQGILELHRGRGAVVASDPRPALHLELTEAARGLARLAHQHGLSREDLGGLVSTAYDHIEDGETP